MGGFSWRNLWGVLKRRKVYSQHEPNLPRISSAAAKEASREELIRIAALGLLEVGHADRTGIWLASSGEEGDWKGRVEDKNRDVTPPEWSRLAPSLPFLRPWLENGPAFLQKVENGEGMAMFGPLLGMKRALWTPIRLGTRLFGIALTAWTHGNTFDSGGLRTIVDELSLALAQRTDVELCRARDSELAFRSQIQKNILAGAPAKQSLERIARRAAEFSGCLFVELGISREGTVQFEICEGPPGAGQYCQQEPLPEIWKKALEDRRAVGTSANIPAPGRDHQPGGLAPRNGQMARVVAIPLLAGEEPLGILVSGFAEGRESLADLERLETYAVLATMALSADAGRRRESAIQASRANRLESTPDMILMVDQDGVVREASRTALVLLGQYAAWVGHLRLEDLFVGLNRPALALREKALPGEVGAGVAEGVLPSGKKVRLRNRGALRSRSAGNLLWEIVLEDLTAKERKEDVLGRDEAEVEALLDSLETGVVIFDAVGTIRHVNQRFGELLGIDRVRVMELGNAEALTAELMDRFADSEGYAARWRDVVSGRDAGAREELALDRPAPRVLERLVRTIFNREGTRVGWLENYRDLTAQKLAHLKLQQAGKLAALGRMASGLAHELNNPLTSILGYAQLLLDRPRGTEKNADLRKIYHEAERASHIAKNLLHYARESRSERSLVDLNEVVRRTLSLRDYELRLENIRVVRDLDPHLPPVLADPGQMQQVVLNLFLNAEQAIHQVRGRGHIRIRTKKLPGERAMLEVADDGPGIPQQIAAHIFDPFFTTKPAGQGTGLGLSIVKEIIEEYDGTVRLGSSRGPGATFQIQLPAADAAALSRQKPRLIPAPSERVEPVPRPATRSAEPRKHGKHILVVEDEPTVAQLIADVLREEGHRVETLLDSREGLELAQRQSYDLVICDLKMPQLDGRAFYAALESSGNPLQRHILFVTGDTLAPHTMEFLEAHHLPFVAKPFLVEELKRAVERAINTAASSARAACRAAASGSSRESVRKK